MGLLLAVAQEYDRIMFGLITQSQLQSTRLVAGVRWVYPISSTSFMCPCDFGFTAKTDVDERG